MTRPFPTRVNLVPRLLPSFLWACTCRCGELWWTYSSAWTLPKLRVLAVNWKLYSMQQEFGWYSQICT